MERKSQKNIWYKITDLFSRISKEVKETVHHFPCTIFTIFVFTILLFLFYDMQEKSVSDLLFSLIIPFLGFFGTGMFACESIFKKKSRKCLGTVFAAVVSAALAYGVYMYRDLEQLEGNLLTRSICAYLIVLFLLGVYFCYRSSGTLLPEYSLSLFSNLIKIHIVYVILLIGTIFISSVIYVLFLEQYSFDLISRLVILITGFFYVPACLYSVYQIRRSVDSFTKILIKYVLLPLVSLVFVIIYAYMVKILIQRSIPSNQIFMIVTSLFLTAMPTWTMMETIDQPQILRKISSKLPLVFVPLILLQIYSVGVRIFTYGVKPERYLGAMWILLEVIYLFIYWKKRGHAGVMILIGAIFAGIAFLAPFVNMYQVSLYSQDRILSQYRREENISSEIKKKINGAYLYLQEIRGGEKAIGKYEFTEEEIAEITEYYGTGYDGNSAMYARLQIELLNRKTEIDIHGFSQMQEVSNSKYSYTVDSEDDLKNCAFLDSNMSDPVIEIDMEDYIDQYIEYAIDQWKQKRDNPLIYVDDYYAEHYLIEVDEDTRLVISDLNIDYDREEEEIDYLYIEGYLLKR